MRVLFSKDMVQHFFALQEMVDSDVWGHLDIGNLVLIIVC